MQFNPKKFISVSLLSAMLLTGCKQPEQPTDFKSDKVSAVSTTSSTTTQTAVLSSAQSSTQSLAQNGVQNTVTDTTTAQALLTVLSGLMYKSFNENPKQKLTDEQKTCLIKADYHEQLANFQRYLQTKLTADELTKTNQYYALPVGQKQIQIANQQLHARKGEKIANPVKLTDDEKLQMQAFQGTPEAQKLAEILNQANQADLEKMLTEPMAVKAMADCHIEVVKVESATQGTQVVSSVSSTKP